jgi:hypothetical protein
MQRREEDREDDDWQRSREDMIRTKQRLQSQVDSGVNIPQLDSAQMRQVKQGLVSLFENEINR